jgi:hypothetical protein
VNSSQNSPDVERTVNAKQIASPKVLKFVIWIQIPLIVLTIAVYGFVWASIPGLLRKRQELLANNASLKRDNDALARRSQELLNQQIYAHATTSGDSVPVRLSDLSGTWKNVDEGTRGLTRLGIRVVDKAVFVHAWGKCHPTDCDWGEVPAVPYARDISSTPSEATLALAATFKTNFEESVLTIRPESSSLRVETVTRFTDNSGRNSYTATDTFHRAS